ncbi:MAG: hypothetical protein K2X69_06540 [Silvanigrellaceae bacterium]|nr:hypothetical protein [Silvanigrellaceae bacterium]
MGAKSSPSIVNIYISTLEKNFQKTFQKLLVYRRLIDDIILIVLQGFYLINLTKYF